MKQTYSYSPRPVGGSIAFTLKGSKLTIEHGRKVYEVSLDTAETVRMTYEPGRIGRKSFHTKVTLKNGKSFSFGSLHWKGLVEAQEMTAEYRAFAKSLCETIAKANPQARFIAGKPWWLWFSIMAVAALSLLAMAYLIWHALQLGSVPVALFGAIFVALGIWQIEPMVRLNKPRFFSSSALPEELLPKAS